MSMASTWCRSLSTAPANRRFATAPDGPREGVLPGNRSFSAGDKIPKPPGGAGGGGRGGNASDSGESEDDFSFVLSREEVLDLFFEDLELPDLSSFI